MASAVRPPPVHPGKDVKRLEHMSEHDYDQAPRTQELDEGPSTPDAYELDQGGHKEGRRWHEREK